MEKERDCIAKRVPNIGNGEPITLDMQILDVLLPLSLLLVLFVVCRVKHT